MPYKTVVRCCSNGRRLASFDGWPIYWYRLADGITFPLNVAYAWCHRCERFVEAEQLYTVTEIEERLNARAAERSRWPEIDAEREEIYTRHGGRLPPDLTCQALYETWTAALAWRNARKSPPRCLECGSFFAIVVIPRNEVVPHPDGQGAIEVAIGGHWSGQFPDDIYFDGEGVRQRVQ